MRAGKEGEEMQDALHEIAVPITINVGNLSALCEKVSKLADVVEEAKSLANEVASLGKSLSLEVDV